MARILIIDDDYAMRRALCAALSRHGYDAVEASNGMAGLKAYRAEPADLVITDVVMPDMDGTEVLIELKKEPRVPKIIMISGVGRASSYLKVAQSLGADAILEKPVTAKTLLSEVSRVLSCGE